MRESNRWTLAYLGFNGELESEREFMDVSSTEIKLIRDVTFSLAMAGASNGSGFVDTVRHQPLPAARKPQDHLTNGPRLDA